VDISIPGLTVVVVAVVVDIILCLMKCWAKKLYLRSGNLKARFGRQKQQKEPGT
jgi:Na+-translocating ferredoxin:NAD+ oxidoreductase RnfE subunit